MRPPDQIGKQAEFFFGGALEHSAARQYNKGFRMALERANLSADRIIRVTNNGQGGRRAVADMRAQDTPPTARVYQ